MKNSIFILSHQDDEIGIFESIRIAVENKENVIIFYMTNGVINKSIPKEELFHRDKESITVLKKIGVEEKKIIFLGRLNNIPTCSLYKKLEIAYLEISKFLNTLNGDIELFTHAYEGGNEDHDSCNILVLKIIRNFNNINLAFQFPFYNAYSSIFFYSTQKALKINGEILKIKTNFTNRIKYIGYLFYYKSQLKVWIGLYPFLIFNFITRNYYLLQKIDKNFFVKKPHQGTLLYEKFRNTNYANLESAFIKFLK